jgi:hypothetical protein
MAERVPSGHKPARARSRSRPPHAVAEGIR